ncbi:hypothetical protein [Paenibacillus senegalimassiliensis]|uniref:hypothetical protein n=1 Tax=Paenibacillus senegalimassiliensis TaxID=1737426 RepID=UPI00073EAE1C|nr:hypothetical protein [Paenibacillus senegalimassiliensis]
MDYIKPVEIDLNVIDDEPFQLYYEKQAKKEQFTRQLALLLSKTMDVRASNDESLTTGVQE